MKTYFAYDVNPRLLFKRLKDANQPVVGIKFYGPAVTKVTMACIGCTDGANDGTITAILAEISGPKQVSAAMQQRENQLKSEFQA